MKVNSQMRSSHKKYIDVLEKNRDDCSPIIELFVDMDKEKDFFYLINSFWYPIYIYIYILVCSKVYRNVIFIDRINIFGDH